MDIHWSLGKNNAWGVHIRNEHRKQPMSDIGDFGTPRSSNRLINNYG
jgi:hypothetical protein